MNVVEKTGGRRRHSDPRVRGQGRTPGPPSSSTLEPIHVLAVGPPLDTIGGMTSVVRQTLSLNYSGRYTVEHLPTCHAPSDRESIPEKLRRHWRQIGVLRRAVRRTRARLVHLHTCSGFSFYLSAVEMVIVRGMSCRTILHIHGASFDDFFAHSGRVAKWVIAKSLSFANVVVGLSASWRTRLQEMAPHACITVIENAVEIPPAPASSARREGDERCHFVVLARMDDWKGIGDALAAAAMLHDRDMRFRMTLAGPAGSAGDADTLPRKIKSLGLSGRVAYVGPVLGRAKTELFHAADVFLQPSHHEGMPIAVLEALASGLPVVATAVGAVPEVIERDVQGFLVPARAPEALSDAMTKMILDQKRRAAMGVAARRLAEERFSLGRFDRDLTDLYDALLGVCSSARVAAIGTVSSSLRVNVARESSPPRVPETA